MSRAIRRPSVLARALAALILATVALAAASIPADASGPSARVVRHGTRSEKVVALTFDDGWGHAADEAILETLLAEQVTATFFPYALTVRGNKAFWRRVARLGFPIGNHTYSHPNLTRLSTHSVEWEIAAARRLIEEITGVPMLRVFRPPYGAYDARVLAAAGRQGFPTLLMWDATTGDSGGRHAYGSVLRGGAGGSNGSIVLLHAGPTTTAAALRDIIRSYKARGFRFVTVPELLGDVTAPWPAASPTPTPTGMTGQPATPAASGTLGPSPTFVPAVFGTPGPSASPVVAPSPRPTAFPAPTSGNSLDPAPPRPTVERHAPPRSFIPS